MRNQCKCKLPYVINGTADCTICHNDQSMFLRMYDKPITTKGDFNGAEFKRGDIAMVIGKSYSYLVEVQEYIPKGWYRVKLPNGGYHETQIIEKIK